MAEALPLTARLDGGRWEIFDAEGWEVGRSYATSDGAEAKELALLYAASPDLLAALKGVSRGHNCWCEKAVGNPMQKEHTRQCKAARAAVDKAEDRLTLDDVKELHRKLTGRD